MKFKVGDKILIDCFKNSIYRTEDYDDDDLVQYKIGEVISNSPVDKDYEYVVKFEESDHYELDPYITGNYDDINHGVDQYYAGVNEEDIMYKIVANTVIAKKLFRNKIIEESAEVLYVKKDN